MTTSIEKEKARALRQSQWWSNLIHSNPACYYCANKLEALQVTMDHVVPLSKGGKSTKSNIVVCCKPCNSKKKHMTAVEFLLSDKSL